MIELLYLIPIAILIITALAVWFEQLNWFVALCGSGLALFVAWLYAPYSELVMSPLSNALWHGYTWGWTPVLALIHLISIFFMLVIAFGNLWLSKGKKLWG